MKNGKMLSFFLPYGGIWRMIRCKGTYLFYSFHGKQLKFRMRLPAFIVVTRLLVQKVSPENEARSSVSELSLTCADFLMSLEYFEGFRHTSFRESENFVIRF